MAKTVDEVAEAMFNMVKETMGIKKLKPGDLQKAMKEMFPGEVDRKVCKDAIRKLVDEGRLVYTYFGGSYLEIPHREGAAND